MVAERRRQFLTVFAAGIATLVLVVVIVGGSPATAGSAGGAHSPVRPGPAPSPSEGQTLFEQKCKACHTIGGGRTVGPDLKGIGSKRDGDWLVRFTVAPDRLIAQGDPIAREIVAEYGLPMPNVGVSEEQARSILAYIEQESGAGPPPTTAAIPTGQPGAGGSQSGGDRGRRLFAGQVPFKNGGPSCISCHNAAGLGVIGGGTVGRDLTPSYSLMGEAGLTAVLKASPFRMMKEIYSSKPLLDEEIAGVVAFLGRAEEAQRTGPPQSPAIFFALSAAGALVALVLFQFLWRGRLSGVRRPLVKGGPR